MDAVRFGLTVRALRRRRGWTQAQLAARCGLSQSTVSDVETGHAFTCTVDTLARVIGVLGVRLQVKVLGNGEDADRLLDARHADIVERVAAYMRRHGWEVVPEATFSVYGERGSIDLLAFHPATGSLLVVEVKSAIPDVQATLAGIDRKARLAPTVAEARGWRARSVSRWLVVPGDPTSRRRVQAHDVTLNASLPARTAELKRWAGAPSGPVAGILFVASTGEGGTRNRSRVRTASPTVEARR
jgi:transcriptional regulator with XRE-family HTH domain